MKEMKTGASWKIKKSNAGKAMKRYEVFCLDNLTKNDSFTIATLTLWLLKSEKEG
jgi:hypothetical protein